MAIKFDYEGNIQFQHTPYSKDDQDWKGLAEDYVQDFNNLARIYNALSTAVMARRG